MAAVEAHDNVVTDGDDRNRHPAGLRDQLVAGGRVLRDVLRRELDPARRKKLFRRVTRLSGGGPVHRDWLIRHRYAPSRRPPKMRRPSLKPSATVVAAPGISGFVSHHALRCSSDRKKLIVVQRESETRHRSSDLFPIQSMRPSAAGRGPSGATENSRAILE